MASWGAIWVFLGALSTGPVFPGWGEPDLMWYSIKFRGWNPMCRDASDSVVMGASKVWGGDFDVMEGL